MNDSISVITSKFTPKPAELHEACCEAHRKLYRAHAVLEEFTDYLRRCDAIVLEFDFAEWQRLYQTPEHQPILIEMLRLHWIYGDSSLEFNWDEPVHPLRALIEVERAKLLLPAPEPEREAACTAKPAKKTHRPKRKKKNPKSDLPDTETHEPPTDV